MKHRYFLPLLIVLSILQTATVIDFTTLDLLFIGEDHPKFYSFSVEQAELLLRYGTPFGFNHNFQGGIPTIYLRSCFLELIPFALFFGYPLGYQIMLIVFLALIPLSLFYLVRQWTGEEELAMITAFLAAIYAGGYYVRAGMTPVVVGYSLSFMLMFFFLRMLSQPKPYYFPLILTGTLLAYTHLLFFVLTGLACAVIFLIRTFSAQAGKAVRRAAVFIVLLAVVLSGLAFQLIHYRNYLRFDYACDEFGEIQSRWGYFFNNVREILLGFGSMDNNLLLTVIALGICFRRLSEGPRKRLTGVALFLSLICLFLLFLDNLTTINIFFARINSFVPYLLLFNIALIISLPLMRYWQHISLPLFAAVIFLFFFLNHPLLPTVKSTDKIDPVLSRMLFPGEFVLLENRAHVCSVAGDHGDRCYPLEHWETYLQRELGIKAFAHAGEDAQPYNALRQMYVVNGRYSGKKLDGQTGKALTDLMFQWGVGKACVWSPAAIAFFQESSFFTQLGQSKYYTCFQGTYPVQPEVVSSGSAQGKLLDVTPFSFRIHLTGVMGQENVIVNKNYFPFWSARDREGRSVVLRREGQRISFTADQDGDVLFTFEKNHGLQLVGLSGLCFAGAVDLLQIISAWRRRRQKRS